MRMIKFVSVAILVMVLVISHQISFARSQIVKYPEVGVNYGFNGNNLPDPLTVVNLINNNGIHKIRIFEPNIEVYKALFGVDIEVCLGVRNEDIAYIASSKKAAFAWADKYIYKHIHTVNIMWVTIGNEVIGRDAELEKHVGAAILNLISALADLGLEDLLVSTVVSADLLTKSYPPSEATITNPYLKSVLRILEAKKQPLMVNLYPYYALTSDPRHITLDFALFTSRAPAFTDQGREYYNLFDAMYDAFLAAIARSLGKKESPIQVIVSESGWPSAGSDLPYATIDNARIYNNKLRDHAANGTPRCPGPILVFLFSLFNENMKPEGIQQHFGEYYPNMDPVYPLW